MIDVMIFVWIVLSFVVVGLIMGACMPLSAQAAVTSAIVGKKKCPDCAEFVQSEANVCRFCQHSFFDKALKG